MTGAYSDLGLKADFLSLTPEQFAKYERAQDAIQDLIRDLGEGDFERGLALLLNATVARSPEMTVSMMHRWADFAMEESNPRDFVGIVYERPIEIPRFPD